MKRLVKTPYYIVDGVTYTEGVREFKEQFDEAWDEFKSKCTPIEIKPSLFQRIKKLLFTSLLLLSFTAHSQDSFKFTTDKKLHFLAGAGIGYVVSDIAYKSDRFNDREAIVLGVFTSYVVGAGKKCMTFTQRMVLHRFKTLLIPFTVALLVRLQASESIN